MNNDLDILDVIRKVDDPALGESPDYELLNYGKSLNLSGSYLDIDESSEKLTVYDSDRNDALVFRFNINDLKSAIHVLERKVDGFSLIRLSLADHHESVFHGIKSLLKKDTPILLLDSQTAKVGHEILAHNITSAGYFPTVKVVMEGRYLEFKSAIHGHKKYYDVAAYWEKRYAAGGTSGDGSVDRLAIFKATFLNKIVNEYRINSITELGCGDGSQLSLSKYPKYIGLDISKSAIEKSRSLYSGEQEKSFYIYDPENFVASRYRSELAISLDVIYHLSNDHVYTSYLRDLFALAEKYVVLYTNTSEFYPSGINANAEYIRFRDVLSDIESRFSEWGLVEAIPNQYPFDPSLPKTTSISDFFVFKKNPDVSEIKQLDADFYSLKTYNQTLIRSEYAVQSAKSASEDKSLSAKNYLDVIRQNEDQLSELKDYCELLSSQLNAREDELSRINKELEISRAAEVQARTAEKQAENSLAVLKHSSTYQVGLHIRNSTSSLTSFLKLPVALWRVYRRRATSSRIRGRVLPESTDSHDHIEKIGHLITNDSTGRFEGTRSILYANITLNVVDGSSVWLSSMISLLAKQGKVVVLLKEKITNNLVVDNVNNLESVVLLSPTELGINAPIKEEIAVEILKYMDFLLPDVQRLVVRGMDAADFLHRTRQFKYRSLAYLTDFYTYGNNAAGSTLSQEKVLRNIARQTGCLLVQTADIGECVRNIIERDVPCFEMPPPIPAIPYSPPPPLECETIRIVYAGKITPQWGVVELLDWVESLIEAGISIRLTIVANKITAPGAEGKIFRNLMHRRFEELNVNYIPGAPREDVLKLYKDSHYIWCYRPASLENLVLELSTKLIEAVACGGRAIAYPNSINRKSLGDDYPYFIRNFDDFSGLIRTGNNIDTRKTATRVSSNHSLNVISERMKEFFQVNRDIDQNILFVGHDLKFIDPYYSWLKQQGNHVRVDLWEWGAPVDLKRSELLYKWADVIFCEWGLANAAWYSNRNTEMKPLHIRIHAQEIRERARKFGHQIDVDKVSSFIFVSERVKDEASTLFNWPASKFVHIPNFVLDDEYTISHKKHKTQHTQLALGMVGITPQSKRFDRAVDLLESLVSDGIDAILRVKGHRPETLAFMQVPGRKAELDYFHEIYRRIGASSNIKDRVFFDPWANDVAEWYEDIDVILSPSDHESFHYALADGVLSGCFPVIWPWPGSEMIYPVEWRVDNTEHAEEVIKSYNMLSADKRSSMALQAREAITSIYGKTHVFEQLTSAITSCHMGK